jgi:hypothetical protein
VSPPAAVGARVRTGRAVAVLLAGPREHPRWVERREIRLWDPEVPESQQPYHAALGLSGSEAEGVLRRATAPAGRLAGAGLDALLATLRDRTLTPVGVGLVVGSLRDPARVASPHMRAHAAEGALFREVLEAAARERGLPCRAHLEGSVLSDASVALGHPEETLRGTLAELGRVAGRPWRADEKNAAAAAWVALADSDAA